MKVTLTMFLFLIIYSNLFGQVKQIDSIEYKLYRIQGDISNGVFVPSKYIVEIIKIPEDLRRIGKYNKRKILSLLEDEKTSWEMNLYLYSKYEKDASWFIGNPSKREWISSKKSKDIEYWRSVL